MLGVGLGLMNWRGLGTNAYAVEGKKPATIADFKGELNGGTELYKTNNALTTFDDMFTYSGASNKTMIDSDGYLKWAPHNLCAWSEDFTQSFWVKTNATVTGNSAVAPDGTTTADLVEPTGAGQIIGGNVATGADTAGRSVWMRTVSGTFSVRLRDANDGTQQTTCNLTTSWQQFTLDSSTLGGTAQTTAIWIDDLVASSDFYIWGAHVYRSDLGGMVNNPDRGDSYVPTTTAAVYQARRNAYRYNGSSYVKKGITIEPLASTNLEAASNDFTNATYYVEGSVQTTTQDAAGPDGETTAWTIADDSSGGSNSIFVRTQAFTVSTSTTYCVSAFFKASGLDEVAIRTSAFTTGDDFSYFDLSTGTVSSEGANHDDTFIEDVGGGWYRCSVVFTTDVADTAGLIWFYGSNGSQTVSVSIDGTSSFILYGAQVEVSPIPTSYIPTIGGTATRSAETLKIAAANMAYDSSAMSFDFWGTATHADLDSSSYWYPMYWFENSTNRLITYYANNSTNNRFLSGHQGGGSLAFETETTPGQISADPFREQFRVAVRHTGTRVNLAVNGTAEAATTHSEPIPDLSSTENDLVTSTFDLVCDLALFRQWDVDIGDTGIAEASDSDTAAKIAALFSTDTYTESGVGSTFDDIFTYSTTSNSTMIDSDGYLKWAPHNLVLQSSDFSTSWTLARTTVSTDAIASPTGDVDADKIVDTTDTGVHAVTSTAITITAGATYTAAIYWKAAEVPFLELRVIENNGGSAIPHYVVVDTSDGSTQTSTNFDTITLDDVGDGWYRTSATFTADTDLTSVSMRVYNSDDGTAGASYTGNGTDGTYLWGAGFYRSDLGGMANNPDRGDSYVPTTTAGVYLPRRNAYRYTGAAYENNGLLIDSAAATNMVPNSQDFSTGATAPWTHSTYADTAQDTVGPDGVTNSATTLKDDNSGGSDFIYASRSFTVSTTTAYTGSVYAKAGDLNFIVLAAVGFTTPANSFTWFNLSTGAVGTTDAAHTATIEDVGNGWYRCSITFTTDAADTSGELRIYVDDADNADRIVDRDDTSNIKIFGAQFEEGTVPTSYIPTGNGTTQTRAAQTLKIPAANMSWNNEGQSFQMEGEMSYAPEQGVETAVWMNWEASSQEKITNYLNTSATKTGEYTALTAKNAVIDFVQSGFNEISDGVNVPYNFSSRLSPTTINMAYDGTVLTPNKTVLGITDISAIDVNVAEKYVGYIIAFRYWDKDIYDAGIEEETS